MAKGQQSLLCIRAACGRAEVKEAAAHTATLGCGWQAPSLTTWWQLNSFMTDASLRNSMRSRMLADSLTVLMATRVSASPFTTPLATPSYTMPKEPWPSSRHRVIFSLATSHSSGTYTGGSRKCLLSTCRTLACPQQSSAT